MAEPIDVHKVFAEYFKGSEALAYALSAKLGEGNICVGIDEYKAELPQLLEDQKAKATFKKEDSLFWVSPEEFEKQCNAGDYLIHDTDALKPFVIHNRNAYLHRYFHYETQIIKNITRLGKNFHIITGGPGSGKTYSVSEKLVEMFGKEISLKVALAAPTGKAAARMVESIKDFPQKSKQKISDSIKEKLLSLEAQTIHRLLGYISDSVFFRYNEKNRLPYDVIIIDECSMVDGAMMAKLLDAIDDKTILYLIGDKDQLASVEAGSVFGDICRAGESVLLKDKVEVKTESHRFETDKGIGRFSREVIAGTFSDPGSYADDGQISIDTSFSNELIEKYAILYSEYINENEIEKALKKLNWIRFLCVTRENDNSVSKVNKQIQYYLSKQIPEFRPKSEGFYHNQPIIVTKNDYKLGIFNGDVGIIRKKKTDDGEILFAYFETIDGKIKEIQAGYLNHYETVFAMTIHKSQGSEFNYVVVILPEKQGEKLLTRELLYTGVTRARTNEKIENTNVPLPAKSVLLQTSDEVLKKCVNKSVSRASGLEDRLKNVK
jgi:exodeoxyribonuclease V alpha subunit